MAYMKNGVKYCDRGHVYDGLKNGAYERCRKCVSTYKRKKTPAYLAKVQRRVAKVRARNAVRRAFLGKVKRRKVLLTVCKRGHTYKVDLSGAREKRCSACNELRREKWRQGRGKTLESKDRKKNEKSLSQTQVTAVLLPETDDAQAGSGSSFSDN